MTPILVAMQSLALAAETALLQLMSLPSLPQLLIALALAWCLLLGLLVTVALAYFVRSLVARCDSTTAGLRLPKDAYKGKVVWVTGASSGLGKTMAEIVGAQVCMRMTIATLSLWQVNPADGRDAR
eukprot:2291824-Pleurochrysis_carterae.AAC.1